MNWPVVVMLSPEPYSQKRNGLKQNRRSYRKLVKRGPKPKYPWREWLGRKGTVTTLTQGRHFDCAPHGFAVQARRVAARLKIRLGVDITYHTISESTAVYVTLRNKGAA